jgi:5-methylcytosine-specific restriction endonuclease McrA
MKKPGYAQCTGDDWQKARMRALVRDNFTCQYQALGLKSIEDGCCSQQPETRLRYLQVHHIQERINGGSHDLDNLITVCRAHHAHIHPHMDYQLADHPHILEYNLREL